MGMGCIFDSCVDRTLPETNRSSHLKMNGLKTIVSFWDGLFGRCELLTLGRVYHLTFSEANQKNLHFCLVKLWEKHDFASHEDQRRPSFFSDQMLGYSDQVY